MIQNFRFPKSFTPNFLPVPSASLFHAHPHSKPIPIFEPFCASLRPTISILFSSSFPSFGHSPLELRPTTVKAHRHLCPLRRPLCLTAPLRQNRTSPHSTITPGPPHSSFVIRHSSFVIRHSSFHPQALRIRQLETLNLKLIPSFGHSPLELRPTTVNNCQPS